MEDEWRDVLLEELAAPLRNALVGGPFGSELVSADYSPSGVPVIRGENLSNGRWVTGEFVYVSPAKAEQLSANTTGPLDIVFTQRGANHYRQVAIVPMDANGRFVISQSQMKLTVDRDKADPLFVYYLFRSPLQQEYLQRHAIQTGVPHTNLSILRKVPLRVPPLETQRAIARILGTLDDKIELNRRMNETLEGMARAIFNSWFVDFDPVRAKAEGRDPGLPKQITDLFPDHFEGSELGEIPTEWEVVKVEGVAKLSRDSINPSDFPDEIFEHFSIPAFDEGETPKRELGSTIKSNKFLIPSDAILLSKLNPRIPRLWLPVVKHNPRAICSTEFLVVLPRIDAFREFIYGFLSSDAFVDVFETLVTGTSGSHQRVKPEGLLSIKVIIPDKVVIQEFSKMVQPLLVRTARAREESHTLAALRDTLLPKLISGELRVKDADAFHKGVGA